MASIAPELVLDHIIREALAALRSNTDLVTELFRTYSASEKAEYVQFIKENKIPVVLGWPQHGGRELTIPMIVVEPSTEREDPSMDLLDDHAEDITDDYIDDVYETEETLDEGRVIALSSNTNLIVVGRDPRQSIMLQRVLLAILINTRHTLELAGLLNRKVSLSGVQIRNDLLPEQAGGRMITFECSYWFRAGVVERLQNISLDVIVTSQLATVSVG